MIIKVADEFTASVGSGYRKEGPKSGEEFREDILLGKLKKSIADGEILTIDFDGCFGFPPSFTEEAFGGLYRINNIDKQDIIKHISIIYTPNPGLTDRILKQINDAKKA